MPTPEEWAKKYESKVKTEQEWTQEYENFERKEKAWKVPWSKSLSLAAGAAAEKTGNTAKNALNLLLSGGGRSTRKYLPVLGMYLPDMLGAKPFIEDANLQNNQLQRSLQL